MQNQETQKSMVVLSQNNTPKIQADNVEDLVRSLYKGLRLQKTLGKRFLKLSTTTAIHIPLKGTKYLNVQRLSANAFNEVEMLEVVKFLNS